MRAVLDALDVITGPINLYACAFCVFYFAVFAIWGQSVFRLLGMPIDRITARVDKAFRVLGVVGIACAIFALMVHVLHVVMSHA
jgi:hypothetical protein